MLYNKWRPAVFADVFGQTHITKTLLSQLKSGNLAHAYLFTGSRGTGKTSCAKILARAINCTAPIDGEPCNKCEVCLSVINGSAPDVAEIDAASNSGVDNIRSIREELVYTPVMCKKRVYIIDEVHMLSTGAFNALLKTLEEPPGHALFILATTETHKVPATIISRCQRFAFRRIPHKVITDRLRAVCEAEKINIEPDALELLARMSDGALRDSLSLLEQCAGANRPAAAAVGGDGGPPLTEASVRETMGLTGLSDLADWLSETGDLPKSMARLNGLYQGGMDISAILGQLSSLLRDLLMGQMTGDLSLTRLPAAKAKALSEEWPKERILHALEQFAETRLSRSGDKKLEADLCLIRLSGSIGKLPQPKAVETAERESGEPPPGPAPAPTPAPIPADAFGGGGDPPPPKVELGADWEKLLGDTDDPFMQGLMKGAGGAGAVRNAALEEMVAVAGDLIKEE
jgi:DNA polymerase-3 subunit gamma/tau